MYVFFILINGLCTFFMLSFATLYYSEYRTIFWMIHKALFKILCQCIKREIYIVTGFKNALILASLLLLNFFVTLGRFKSKLEDQDMEQYNLHVTSIAEWIEKNVDFVE